MQSSLPPQGAVKTNIYAALSPVNAGLAFLTNIATLFSAIFPPLTYICAVISGAFSLGAILTGLVGLMRINQQAGLEKGKGLAIAGIVLGVLGLIAACLIPLISTAIAGWIGLQLGDQLLVPVE